MTKERLERLDALCELMRRNNFLDGPEYWEMLELQEEFDEWDDTEKPTESKQTPLLPPE